MLINKTQKVTNNQTIKQNSQIIEMASSQQPAQQIREFKDFTTVTSIRKIVQQSMAPTIKTLEVQLSSILAQYQDINRKLMKMQDIFKNQGNLDRRIEQTNKYVNDFKEELMQKRKEDQRKSARLDTANQKLFIQIHAVKTKVDNQDQIIQQIALKNNKTNQMYSALSATNQKTLKQVQQKFSNFTQQLLTMSADIKTEHNQIQSEIDTVRETFKSQRQALQEKAKPLELYLSQRQGMNDKFHDIYGKILHSVTKQDFEGYRKSQTILFKDKTSQIQNKIQKILPESLRKILPTIQKKINQVDKIKQMQKHFMELQNNLKQAQKRATETQNIFNLKIQTINTNLRNQSNKIEEELSRKLQQLQKMQSGIAERLQQKMQQMNIQLQEEVSVMIERETSEIHKTIQAEVASNSHHRKTMSERSKNEPELITQQKADQILEELEKVQQLKEKIFGRYNKIQEVGRSIDNKIQGYSSKITKIKSDYELFAENIRRQISGVIKFKDTFLERLMGVGGLLSTFAQALLINTSILIQNQQKQRESYSGTAIQNKNLITFVTQNDGIIYEWKPQNPIGIIQYRKEKLESRQFLLSYMYSLTTFIDDQFATLNFLNWNQQKPSQFFHQRLLSNYLTCIKRAVENEDIHKQVKHNKNRRLSYNSSYQVEQNQNTWMASDADNQQATDPTGSTKQFSRTIDSKARFERTLEQGNFVNFGNANIQSNKNYNIKRQKPLSGKSKSKHKGDNELTRYDKVFLTSRSACRSRLSQIV